MTTTTDLIDLGNDLPIQTEINYNKVVSQVKKLNNDDKYKDLLFNNLKKKRILLRQVKYNDLYHNVFRPSRPQFINIVTHDRCGIEVLNMYGETWRGDGVYRGRGLSVKVIKQKLKDNKVRGYSKLRKVDLIKLLIKM